MGNRWGSCLLVFLVVLAAATAGARAQTRVYLYEPEVAAEVDLDAYLADGTVQQVDGQGFPKYVDRGPAPADYPTIAIAEKGFEVLGLSGVKIDGVIFVNHGQYLKPNKKALVLWMIRVPNASARSADEFEQDLTLSMWVDWNQDNAWKESERMTQKSLNIGNWFPTTHGDLYLFYLAYFTVPDVTMTMESNKKYGGSGSKKDIRHMWVRAALSYDDPDNSPDGEQLFGDSEDYRIAYRMPSGHGHDDGDDDDDDHDH
jgi:hypothetical protein